MRYYDKKVGAKMRKCSWCGEREATENCVGGVPVYCEKCQRELLQKYGDKVTLELWEKKHEKVRG